LQALKKGNGGRVVRGEFLRIDTDSCVKKESVLVSARAGDLILWDSRTIHYNLFNPSPPKSQTGMPYRLGSYVCMVPADRSDLATDRRRIDLFKRFKTTNHHPVALEMGDKQDAWSCPKKSLMYTRRGKNINAILPNLDFQRDTRSWLTDQDIQLITSRPQLANLLN
jgi:hypothetical protein